MKKSNVAVNKIIVGVDEAGRGPLAGPVTVTAFWAPASARTKLIKLLGGRIRDSKQLSPLHRTEIYRSFTKFQKNREVNFAVCHISNLIIDKKGISHATNLGISMCLQKCQGESLTVKKALLSNNKNCQGFPLTVRLDGLLKAPEEYKSAGWRTKTIIKGDEKDVFIACASIIAKVRRDRLMCRLAKKYPQYGFEIHKGYGTKLHRKLIIQNGLSPIHRVYFCKKLTA